MAKQTSAGTLQRHICKSSKQKKTSAGYFSGNKISSARIQFESHYKLFLSPRSSCPINMSLTYLVRLSINQDINGFDVGFTF